MYGRTRVVGELTPLVPLELRMGWMIFRCS